MARKSRELRTNQTLSLIQEYEADNLCSDYRYRFLSDVYRRLLAGKHLTARQRTWLDNLIAEGLPKINRDNDLICQIQGVMKIEGMEHRKLVLGDFIARLSGGRSLTEKQASFLTVMLEEAEKIKSEGPYVPSEDVRHTLSQCILLSEGYSSMYWQTHPGTARALANVKAWIDGCAPFIDEWSVSKTLKAMSSRLRELRKPYVSSGDLVWCSLGNHAGHETGVVSGCPEITELGKIVYPVLCMGEILMLEKQKLSKRNRTRK
jgi:hypothetical protein|tara:strand:- start:2190 stop:2975 length:786 start_codon:yes stop_codon:yes gene_type:complete